jgi:hypothetical protein
MKLKKFKQNLSNEIKNKIQTKFKKNKSKLKKRAGRVGRACLKVGRALVVPAHLNN